MNEPTPGEGFAAFAAYLIGLVILGHLLRPVAHEWPALVIASIAMVAQMIAPGLVLAGFWLARRRRHDET